MFGYCLFGFTFRRSETSSAKRKGLSYILSLTARWVFIFFGIFFPKLVLFWWRKWKVNNLFNFYSDSLPVFFYIFVIRVDRLYILNFSYGDNLVIEFNLGSRCASSSSPTVYIGVCLYGVFWSDPSFDFS